MESQFNNAAITADVNLCKGNYSSYVLWPFTCTWWRRCTARTFRQERTQVYESVWQRNMIKRSQRYIHFTNQFQFLKAYSIHVHGWKVSFCMLLAQIPKTGQTTVLYTIRIGQTIFGKNNLIIIILKNLFAFCLENTFFKLEYFWIGVKAVAIYFQVFCDCKRFLGVIYSGELFIFVRLYI